MQQTTHELMRLLGAIAMVASVAAPAWSQAQTKPDNTAVNQGDASSAKPTADHQANTRSDVETTRETRRAIVADTSLSAYAHNVKIVTRHGKVTLRGPVRTEAEKGLLQTKAVEIAGGSNVTNAITVTPAKAGK